MVFLSPSAAVPVGSGTFFQHTSELLPLSVKLYNAIHVYVIVMPSLARHTPQSKGKEGSGDSAYCELFCWNAITASFERVARRAQDNIIGE